MKKKGQGKTMSAFASFRRLIHAHGDVVRGISNHRSSILWRDIPSLISEMVKIPTYKQIISSDAFPRSIDRIRSRRGFSHAEPEIELVWNASVLSYYKDEINNFLTYRRDFESSFLRNDFPSAKKILDQIEVKFGFSLWSITTRFSLVNAEGGLQQQKALLDQIMSLPNVRPIPAFTAYFYSYSLEEGVALSDVRRGLLGREPTTKSSFLDYMRYHVLPQDVEFIERPTDCIAIEETSPIIDRYENFIEMSQILYIRHQELLPLGHALSQLEGIRDLRLTNLLFCLGQKDHFEEDNDFIDACNAYTHGEYDACHSSIYRLVADRPADAWSYELAAKAATASKINIQGQTLAENIILEIQSYLDIDKDLVATRLKLNRLAIVTRKLSCCRMISAIVERTSDLSIVKMPTLNEAMWALSCPLLQPVHFRLFRVHNPAVAERVFSASANKNSGLTYSLHFSTSLTQAGRNPDILALPMPAERQYLYEAYSRFNKGLALEAREAFEEYHRITAGRVRPRTLSFEYALLRELDDIETATAAFSRAYILNSQMHSLYPMQDFAKWSIERGESNATSIDRAILLHAFSAHHGSKRDGDLSDAYEDVLEFFQVKRPSDLFEAGISHEKLVFFLANIATVDRIEDTTGFLDLDDMELERIRVLQWLVLNDPLRRNLYTQEISSITKDQEVARLSAQVERSKIYIHEEGIRRKLKVEIGGLYERYRQVLQDPAVENRFEQIEQRFRRLLNDPSADMGHIVIPSGEKGGIFHALASAVFEIAALDPIHGLRTYLSTRILHGVLEGKLRSSFMSEGMLVALDSSSKEQDILDVWESKLNRLQPEKHAYVALQLVKFSDRVSTAIVELKDKSVRVWTPERPQGLLKVALDADAYDRLEASISSTTPLEEFLDRALAAFWEALDIVLREVRIEISSNFRKLIDSAFTQLEATLNGSQTYGLVGELLDAIARCRVTFLHDLDRVSAWFVRSGVLVNAPFEFETAIQVACRITNNCYPQCELTPVLEAPKALFIRGEILNPIVDMLTNCLQNVAEHSKLDKPAVVARVLTGETHMTATVISPLGADIDVERVQSEILELIQEDSEAHSRAVAGEGKTGIRKMKRILRYDLRSDHPLEILITPAREMMVSFNVPNGGIDERTYH